MSTNLPGNPSFGAVAATALGTTSPDVNQEPEVFEGELMGPTGQEVDSGNPLPVEFKNRRGQRRLENITVEAIEKFLDNLSDTGQIYRSAEMCGLSYVTVNRLRKDDPEFRAMVEESMQDYREGLEAECHRRAIEGWDEPVFSQRLGTQMGVVRKYDSRLLELMLKRHIPEYREKFEGEIKVSGGVLIAPAAPLSIEDWQKRYSAPQQALPDQSAEQ